MNLEGWTILELHRQNDDPSIEGLGRTLSHLFATEGWMENPTQSGLFEFLALCWPHDSLKLLIHDAMQHWTPARREVFIALIENKLAGGATAELIVRSLDQVEPEEVDWLWRPLIGKGLLNFLEGPSGLGKSHLAHAIMAAGAGGWHLPDQRGYVNPSPAPTFNSLLITQEDTAAMVVKPRVMAMGLSESHHDAIRVLEGVRQGGRETGFSLAFLDALEAYIEKECISLVVIDPIISCMPGVDIYRSDEVSDALTPLQFVARRQNCAMLLIRHWVKAVGYGANNRGMGSGAFMQMARSGMCVGPHPEDADISILAHFKHNYSEPSISLCYSLARGTFSWAGVSDFTADEVALMKPNGNRRSSQGDSKAIAAEHWLLGVLGERELEWYSLLHLADQVGYSEKDIQRAVSQLGTKLERYRDSDRNLYFCLRNRPEPSYQID